VQDRVEDLVPLARELGASLAQLALAWCLRRENVASVIVGATRPAQLEENAKACELRIPDATLERIGALFPGSS
jgi:aryl-alcohol dehydrogenase-like predicted oxidoreductase